MILKQAVEDRFRQGSRKLDAGEFVARPDNTAILGLQPGDAEQEPIVGREAGHRLDPAAVSRNVDQARTDAAAAGFPDRSVETQRVAQRAAPVGLAVWKNV